MTARSARKSKRISAKRKKGFSWKKSKAAKRVKRKIRMLFFAVLSLVLTTLLLTLFSLYKFAKAPLISASLGAVEKKGEWVGKNNANILFLAVDDVHNSNPYLKGAYILRLSPQSGTYYILNIPILADVELAERYGAGNLAKAFVLGNLREKKAGISLVQETIFKQLALYSDSYVIFDKNGVSELKNMFGDIDLKDIKKTVSATKLYLNPRTVRFLREHIRANLSIPEIFRVLGYVRGVNGADAKVFEINEESFNNAEFFDGFWRKYVLSEISSEENLRVLVLNGAGIPGLAFWGGRVVENSGLALSGVGNTEKEYKESFLVSSAVESETTQKLARIFGISKVIDRESEEGNNAEFLRGDVVVVLGLDIGNIL